MDFRHTQEQQMWLDTLDRFMEKEVGREYTRKHDADRKFPEEIYYKVAKEGWLGMILPEKLGGLGLDPVMYAIFCEKIAKFSLDTAACFMQMIFTAHNLATYGTEEQQEKYIPAFLKGDQRFAISISEPNAGSDAAAASTKAVRDGDHWVINGAKMWCSGAHHKNTTIVLMARTGEERYDGLTTILVPNDTPGLEIRKLDTIVRRSLGTTQCFYDDVRVPVSNTLGKVGEGWKVIGKHLQIERMSLAASYVGNARTALDDTIRYTKDRKQFGKSLSSFQVVKHRIAKNEYELAAARLLVYSAATMLARGEHALKEVSMAKVFAVDTAFSIAFNGMQSMGGYGQMPEFDMERYFREAKHGMVGGGANEIQRSIIAKEMGI